MGADIDETPQDVRERADTDPCWQRALPLEPAPEGDQLAVALLLSRARGLIDLAQAATDILGNDRFKAGAKQLAVAIGGYGGAAEAAAGLEALG